ncbi:hypothetical protein [Streptomyces sp. NPDC002644]
MAIRAGILVRLWRQRVVPEGPGRVVFPLPRWARILLCTLITALVAFELFMWMSAFTVTSSLSSVTEGSLRP